MQTLPCVQVKGLAPSASFYSSVTQPLGLRFISANSSSIVYGNPDPVFEVKASANAPRPTRMILSVSSPSAVSAFHAAARRANPTGNSNILVKDDDGISGESRACATDIEGNIVEVVYLPGHMGSVMHYTTKQVTRIMDWNLDVSTSTLGAARSSASSVAPSRPGLATLIPTDGESYKYMRRSFTTSTVDSSPPQQQQTSKGLSTGAMVGAVLGAVAAGALGAGMTYAYIKKDRDRTPRQEFDAPPFQRRATYPEPHPDHQPRYVELERTVEKVRYPEQYPPGSNKYPQPAYTTRRSQADSPPVEEVVDDRASRHSPSSRTRDRSTSSPRKPLMITEVEHQSNVGTQHPEPPHLLTETEHHSEAGSRHTTNPKSQLHAELFKRHNPVPSRASSKAPSRAPDARSHVSSRSRRGDDDGRSHVSSRHSTVHPPRNPDAETYVSARSEKSISTVRPNKTETRSKAPSRAPSYVSAREIPSPPKETDWKDLVDDDDKISVAPSDSISCIEERPSK
ncbi:hypothetical protein GQX73_g1555 [Xylaria multiplex]|uniref:VOC domain-containing protein n=1 Tax=Xylaria multiplex TaxID=323545 RepID=A0A7C8ITM6_9PEZI|nr:hypothetical protein GQX73_g1555 [Xylaria multiplex]